jgi:hypothetical protein
MKTANKTPERNFDLLVSILSENEVLNVQAMSHVRGGSADGEGDGGENAISIPKKAN